MSGCEGGGSRELQVDDGCVQTLDQLASRVQVLILEVSEANMRVIRVSAMMFGSHPSVTANGDKAEDSGASGAIPTLRNLIGNLELEVVKITEAVKALSEGT